MKVIDKAQGEELLKEMYTALKEAMKSLKLASVSKWQNDWLKLLILQEMNMFIVLAKLICISFAAIDNTQLIKEAVHFKLDWQQNGWIKSVFIFLMC